VVVLTSFVVERTFFLPSPPHLLALELRRYAGDIS
jgi:hypothetical protein